MNSFAMLLCGFAASLTSGAVLWKINRIGKGLDRQARAREEESILTISGIQAIGHLSEAAAMALRGDKINGEIEKALTYYGSFKDELNLYLLRQNARKNHGA